MYSQRELVNNLPQILLERVTDVVWHMSNDALSILKRNVFSLGTETGPDKTRGGKAFYLSTARSKTGSYSDSTNGIIFKLDGRLLNSRYKGKAIDYWAGSGLRPREGGKHEMEDRIYSEEPVIPNARKYILEINAWIDPHYAKDSVYSIYQKKVEDKAKELGIPYKIYAGYEDFIKNKNPKNSIAEIIDTTKIELLQPYKFRDTRRKNRLKEILLFLSELKDPERKWDRYDSALSLSNDYNNMLRREHGRSALYTKNAISKILRRLKMNSIDDLIKLRVEQAQFMKRINSDKQYLDYKKKRILKSMEDGEDYDFDTLYDLNQQYFKGDKDMFHKITSLYRRGDKEGMEDIFRNIWDNYEKDIKDIQKTLVKLPLSEPEKQKVDDSWRDIQI